MKNIVVLVSGGGTNLQAIIDAESKGELKSGKVSLVVSSNPEAYAIKRAEKNNIPVKVLSRKEFSDSKKYSEALLEILKEAKADLIVLAGFMTILDECVIKSYPYRIINVHPALIPSFCGKGYYGLKVHEAVLKYGVKISGATVHFVNEEADAGAIILQGTVEVRNDDTAEILQKRIMENVEWRLLPKACELFCADRIKIKDNKSYVMEQEEKK